jgi:hypothetical protein
MAHLILKLFPDGRIERLEHANTWLEREELIAYALYLQPGLAALDVAASLWRELGQERQRTGASRPSGPRWGR